MLEDGVNPFEGMELPAHDLQSDAEFIAGDDQELLSVVDSLEEE
jgi:hypothetical protein